MHVRRLADAPSYSALGHSDMAMQRLQGREAGPADFAWLGLSRIAPGGGTTLAASTAEKLYVVLEGEVTISNGVEEATLGRWDSVRLAAGEARALGNRTDTPAAILLVMEQRPAERDVEHISHVAGREAP